MKRMALLGAALAGFALAACAPQDPAAFAEQQWRTCQNVLYPAERVLACSNVIRSDAPVERRVAALIQRGTVFAGRGQHIRAIADYGRALRLDPDNVEVRYGRAELHHQRGAFEDAVADYDAVLAMAPDHASARQRRDAALEGRVRGFEEQIAEISRMISLRPREATLWNNRCWTRVTAGRDLDLALADCNESLRLEPGNAATLDSRALVYFKRGEYALALRDYDAAVAVDAEEAHYLYGRGVTRFALGMTEQGLADINAAEDIEPGIGYAYESYGVAMPLNGPSPQPDAAAAP